MRAYPFLIKYKSFYQIGHVHFFFPPSSREERAAWVGSWDPCMDGWLLRCSRKGPYLHHLPLHMQRQSSVVSWRHFYGWPEVDQHWIRSMLVVAWIGIAMHCIGHVLGIIVVFVRAILSCHCTNTLCTNFYYMNTL